MRKRNVFISLIIVIAMIFQVFAMPFTSMSVLAELKEAVKETFEHRRTGFDMR